MTKRSTDPSGKEKAGCPAERLNPRRFAEDTSTAQTMLPVTIGEPAWGPSRVAPVRIDETGDQSFALGRRRSGGDAVREFPRGGRNRDERAAR